VQDLIEELNARIAQLEQLPQPELKAQIFTVLQLIDQLHRPSVARMASFLKEKNLWEESLNDGHIHLLFTLYDQLPLDELTQVEDALQSVRPYIESHGGDLEVLKVEDGIVHVKLKGSCQSCSASSATLTLGVETALREGYANFKQMVVHEPNELPKGDWIELDVLPVRAQGPVFKEMARLSDLAQVTTIRLEQKHILLVRSGFEVFAYDATCPGCQLSLEGAKLSGHVLVCPWTNCAFDSRNGRRVDGGNGEGLKVYPVAVQGNQVMLAMDFSPTALFQKS
jgi:Fe-S cluster biogenesis protein NfuA/nitrite reductase/ring-hydroxylating ferredoxin subunit